MIVKLSRSERVFKKGRRSCHTHISVWVTSMIHWCPKMMSVFSSFSRKPRPSRPVLLVGPSQVPCFLLLILLSYNCHHHTLEWDSDSLMHRMQGCVIFRLVNKSGGESVALYAICCFHGACCGEVLFCSILCWWMNGTTDSLDTALETALHHQAVWLWAKHSPSLSPHCFFGE